jgi:membrane associated rhomboid family serine protease
MIFPIGDFPNPRGHFPFVNYLLIAANVAVFLLVTVPLGSERPVNGPQLAEYVRVMGEHLSRPEEFRELVRNLSAYDLFVFAHGFRPASPSLVDLFWSMFLHAGLLHLAGNMLFLWIYGDNVEHRLGSLRYLIAYLGTGVAATLFHWMSAPGSQIPVVGASGAISGVLGFYFVFFPRNQVRLLWLLPPFLMQVFAVPARLVLGMYLVLENLLPYLFTATDVGVAHGAHIGGFVAGLACAWLVERRAATARPSEFAAAGDVAEDAVEAALEDGRKDEAARAYFALPAADTRRLLTPAQALALARSLRDHGEPDAALVVLRRLLLDLTGPAAAAAHLLAGQILLNDEDQATSAYQHLEAAIDLGRNVPEIVAAARAAVADIEARQKRRIGTLHRRT